MDIELEKILAKVAGENTENFSERVISDSVKSQINFAFEQMFAGLSLLEWFNGITLGDAWSRALDKMRDFVFEIQEKNYITDYLRMAVFEHRKQMQKMMSASIHINEYMQYTSEQQIELTKSANQKVQNAIDIIKNILSTSDDTIYEKKQNNQEFILQNVKEKECEHERVKK